MEISALGCAQVFSEAFSLGRNVICPLFLSRILHATYFSPPWARGSYLSRPSDACYRHPRHCLLLLFTLQPFGIPPIILFLILAFHLCSTADRPMRLGQLPVVHR